MPSSQTLCCTMGLRNMEAAPALPRESSGKLGLPAYRWGAPRSGCPCFRPRPCSRAVSLLGPQLSACQPRSCPTLSLQVGASPSAMCPAPGCPSRTTSATSPCSPDPLAPPSSSTVKLKPAVQGAVRLRSLGSSPTCRTDRCQDP